MSDQPNNQPPEKQPSEKPASQPKRKQQKIALQAAKDLKAVYSNTAMIANTPGELVIDFIQLLPRTAKGEIVSRVILSPMHAKMLHRALGQNVAQFEKQYGEIRIPTNLADQLFRFPKKDDET